MAEKKPGKVLIVDDDKFLLNMYSVKFKKFGIGVSTAVGGNEALNLLREGLSPDIILLDIVMPAIDGLEVLANIRKDNLVPKAVIIMLTNQGQPSDIKHAQDLGVDGYIVKATTIPSEVLDEVISIYKSKNK